MKAHRRFVLLLALGFALVLIGACAQPSPAPTPAVITPTGLPPTPTSTAIPPTPTATPPPLPPVVVDVHPAPGAEAPPDTPIEVVFSTAVDPASARRALRVSPDVPGDVEVEGAVVRFRPRQPFPRDAWVTVRVKESVKSTAGLPLLRPVYYRFLVQPPLRVTRFTPLHGERGVPITTTVRLAFNRPMVPVNMTNQPLDPPAWLRVDPPVSGEVRWVGTSLLEFTPQPALRSGTWYTVTVAPPLESMDAAPLTEPVSFTFQTMFPKLVSVAGQPVGERIFLQPDAPITLTFNVPMDTASAEGHVRLLDAAQQPVPITLQWPDARTLRIVPETPLALGSDYVLVLDEAFRARDGTRFLRASVYVNLTVIPPIQLLDIDPPPDARSDLNPGMVAVIFSFAGRVDESTLADAVGIIPEPTRVFTYFRSYGNALVVQFEAEPRTTYTVTLKAHVGDVYGNTLGEDVSLVLRTGDFPPSYRLALPWDIGVFDAGAPVTVTLQARNVNTARVTLYRPDARQALRVLMAEPWQVEEWPPAKLGRTLRTWEILFPQEANIWHTADIELRDENGDPLAPGVYVLDLQVTPKKLRGQRRVLLVTPYNVLLKTTTQEALVWVTDVRTGQPVAGVPLALFAEDTRWDVTTDADGIARVTFAEPQAIWRPVWAIVQPDAVLGAASSNWQDGISTWDFRLPASYREPRTLVAHVLTERPVYRPGQTIHWKITVRQDNDGEYRLPPPGTTVHLFIQDPNGEMVYEADLPLNDMGTVSGDLPLDENAPLGFYTFWVEGAELLNPATVLVTAYRKPEFEITVTADPPEVVAGETVLVTAQARYFFGAPVANARVEYVILDEPYTFTWSCPQPPCPPYAFDDVDWWTWRPFPEPGLPLTRGSGVTDAEGRFTLTLPATLKPDQGSRRWTVEVTVYDVSGQTISGRTHVVVHRAGVYPGVAPERYVTRVGDPVTAHVILLDRQGQPVSDGELTFIAYRQIWHNVRKKDADGVFRWVTEVEERPAYTATVRLDATARGTVTFTPPEGGSYRLRVFARDAAGRTATASAYVWVSGAGYIPWRRENNDRLFLVPDKSEYRVGEVARVLVPSPYPGPVEALITLERGSIRQVWRTTLRTNSETLDIPITPDMAPNVFLSVFIVQGRDHAADGLPSFKLGYTELRVDIARKVLDVRVVPEHDRYRPRDTARFTVDVRDAEGRPVDAEVAVALVDKAVLTLFQRPMPLAEAFYRRRGLGVRTATTLVKAVQRRRQQSEPGGKGGGGGGAGGPVPTVREEFLDVAYWQPDLRTGPTGRAVIEAPLPDNLTTWTLLAWAVDAETHVGEGAADIVATQTFLLRPVVPRFFTVGDEARIGVVAHNLGDVPLQARVTMSVTGAVLADPAAQNVVLAPGQQTKITWRVQEITGILEGDRRTLTLFWQGTTDVTGVGDAVRLTLPVRTPVPPEVSAVAGVVAQDASRVEVVAFSPEQAARGGTLRLDLDASLAAGMLDSLTCLEHFPWECSEQTISRFLPNVVTWQALKRLGVENPKLARVLPDLVATAVQRLKQQQNQDGGWGWWATDESNPFLTAYGLWALTLADAAGYPVPEEMMARAADFLARWLQRRPPDTERWPNNRRAMVIFALATYDARYTGNAARVFPDAVALFAARDHLDLYGKALLGLAFGVLADAAPASQDRNAAQDYLRRLIAELERAAVIDPTGAHWEEASWDWWNLNNDIRTTAMVLLLLARHDPENPLAPNVVRWLMSQRRGDRWTHTQDTAWAVIALTAWMEQTGELHPDYTYTAWLNDTVWLEGTMTEADVGRTVTAFAPLTDLQANALNWVRLDRSREPGQRGTGALYYRLQLITYPDLSTLQPLARGVQVERWYTLGDEDTPVTRARVGDLVTVHVRLIVPRGLSYLVVEDPLPAGLEPVDVRLRTTTRTAKGPGIQRSEPRFPWWRWWYWSPTHSELRDDRAAFFQTYLSPGTYEVTYQARATVPGRFVVGPAFARQMYAPEVFGRTGSDTFVVEGE